MDRPLLVPSLAITMAVVSCSGPGPCYGIAPGNKLTITVVEPYDENSHFTLSGNFDPAPDCDFGFDIDQGQVLQASVVSNDGDVGCQVGRPSIAPFGNWTWTLVGPQHIPGGNEVALEGYYTAQNPTCNGFTNLSIYVVSGDPFQPSVPGQVPHVVMLRSFETIGAATAACHYCAATFVVNLRPV